MAAARRDRILEIVDRALDDARGAGAADPRAATKLRRESQRLGKLQQRSAIADHSPPAPAFWKRTVTTSSVTLLGRVGAFGWISGFSTVAGPKDS